MSWLGLRSPASTAALGLVHVITRLNPWKTYYCIIGVKQKGAESREEVCENDDNYDDHSEGALDSDVGLFLEIHRHVNQV
jgi:hypothetical protein